MIDRLMVATLMLLQTPPQKPATDTTASAPRAASKPGRTEAGQVDPGEYYSRRQLVGRSAGAHLALAQWCRDHNLRDEAILHANLALALDPRKDAARKMLGFQKIHGRWYTEEAAREELTQEKADREWAPKLTAWHKALHGPSKKTKLAAQKRAEEAASARDALARIDDARAVPAVYREFGRGAPNDQEIAVQIFGQIPAPMASKALAALAVYRTTPETRRIAIETLRQRKPADYVEALLGLLTPPLRYEVRPDSTGIGGVGSPGVLVIEDKHHRLERTYVGVDQFEQMIVPDFSVRIGDYITYDPDGIPVLHRRNGQILSPRQVVQQYENAAVVTKARLDQDIAQIKEDNAARRAFNEIVFRVLKFATGQNLGEDQRSWTNWLAEIQGLPIQEELVPEQKPTFVQIVKPYAIVMPGNTAMAGLARPYETLPFS
jgi:hypothetical protein